MDFYRSLCYLAIIFLVSNSILFAEKNYNIISILNYDYVSLEEQQYHAPGAGLIFTQGNTEQSFLEEKDSLAIGAFYQPFFMKESRDVPSMFHDMTLMVERKLKRHLILAVVDSSSSHPFSGGIHTFFAGAGYGYEIVRSKNISLYLGGGIAVSDFGDINGNILPVLPVPIVNFSMDYSWINASFQFVTEPSLQITIGPKNRIRFTSDLYMFDYRNLEDLGFECALWYRFFNDDHRLGDFAGLALGVKNEWVGFDLKDRGDRYEIGYNAVFAKLDLSLLQISGGYAFNGREIYNSGRKEKAGDGFFASVQLAYQF